MYTLTVRVPRPDYMLVNPVCIQVYDDGTWSGEFPIKWREGIGYVAYI